MRRLCCICCFMKIKKDEYLSLSCTICKTGGLKAQYLVQASSYPTSSITMTFSDNVHSIPDPDPRILFWQKLASTVPNK